MCKLWNICTLYLCLTQSIYEKQMIFFNFACFKCPMCAKIFKRGKINIALETRTRGTFIEIEEVIELERERERDRERESNK